MKRSSNAWWGEISKEEQKTEAATVPTIPPAPATVLLWGVGVKIPHDKNGKLYEQGYLLGEGNKSVIQYNDGWDKMTASVESALTNKLINTPLFRARQNVLAASIVVAVDAYVRQKAMGMISEAFKTRDKNQMLYSDDKNIWFNLDSPMWVVTAAPEKEDSPKKWTEFNPGASGIAGTVFEGFIFGKYPDAKQEADLTDEDLFPSEPGETSPREPVRGAEIKQASGGGFNVGKSTFEIVELMKYLNIPEKYLDTLLQEGKKEWELVKNNTTAERMAVEIALRAVAIIKILKKIYNLLLTKTKKIDYEWGKYENGIYKDFFTEKPSPASIKKMEKKGIKVTVKTQKLRFKYESAYIYTQLNTARIWMEFRKKNKGFYGLRVRTKTPLKEAKKSVKFEIQCELNINKITDMSKENDVIKGLFKDRAMIFDENSKDERQALKWFQAMMEQEAAGGVENVNKVEMGFESTK